MEKLKIEDFKNIEQPVKMVIQDSKMEYLNIDVYESVIYISTKNNSWALVNEVKKEFEQTINPDIKFWKYFKSNLSYFFYRISEILK